MGSATPLVKLKTLEDFLQEAGEELCLGSRETLLLVGVIIWRLFQAPKLRGLRAKNETEVANRKDMDYVGSPWIPKILVTSVQRSCGSSSFDFCRCFEVLNVSGHSRHVIFWGLASCMQKIW